MKDVKSELHWLHFVGRHTADVVQVIGDSATCTSQFTFADESFTVTRFKKIEGRPIEKQEWNGNHFERLGILAGSLHRIAQAYIPPKGAGLSEWDRTPEANLAEHLPDDKRKLPRLNEAVSEYMAAMPRAVDRYGAIHYDIHSGNYLMTADGRMILLDFENSCRGHYINDVAVVLYYAQLSKFSGDQEDFNRSFLTSFWKGYEKEYAIPVDEICSIPWLLLYRGLIVYGYLQKIWPGELDSDQETFQKRVEQSIVSARMELGV